MKLARHVALGALCVTHWSFAGGPDLSAELVTNIANSYARNEHLLEGGYKFDGVSYNAQTDSWLVSYKKDSLVLGEGEFALVVQDSPEAKVHILGGL